MIEMRTARYSKVVMTDIPLDSTGLVLDAWRLLVPPTPAQMLRTAKLQFFFDLIK
jgi:hypothetical protein